MLICTMNVLWRVFMSFLLIILFISYLNFLINAWPLYLLPFATLLNPYLNSSMALEPCSTHFNLAIFTNLSFSLSNFLFSSTKKFQLIQIQISLSLDFLVYYPSRYLFLLPTHTLRSTKLASLLTLSTVSF